MLKPRFPSLALPGIMNSVFFLPILLCVSLSTQSTGQPYKLTFPPRSNARARLFGTLPSDLGEFTICFWVKVHQIATGRNTILYYSLPDSDNEIRCFFDKNSFGFNRKSATARTRTGLVSLGEWYHICNVWSSWDGHWEIYVNGHLEGNGTGIANGQKVCESEKGHVMVGPDLDDEVDYGISTKDAFVGSIADINLWDEALAEEWVVRKFHCCPVEGNVLAWSKLKVVMSGGVMLAPSYHCRRQCDSLEQHSEPVKKT